MIKCENNNRFLKSNLWSKAPVFGIVLVMVLSAVLCTVPNSIADNRTGNEGNQPLSGFVEDTEIIEIVHADGTHDTAFAANELVYVNITSNYVDLSQPGGGERNELVVANYDDSDRPYDLNNAFTQLTLTPPYQYTANFIAPGTDDHYLLWVRLRQGGGGDQFRTSDVIRVGAGTTPPKHILTCSSATGMTPEWVFATGDTVYIRVYSPNAIDASNSDITFSDFIGNSDTILLQDLADTTMTPIGTDMVIRYNLATDLDLTQFPNSQLVGEYWYTVSVNLQAQGGGQMASDWTAQVRILPPPEIALTTCDPVSILGDGTESTTIFTEFFDEDATGVNNFNVTFKVRDPNNIEEILVDHQTHGNGGLSITDLGSNRYNATFTWTPTAGHTIGTYDIYAEVYDNLMGSDIDGFDNNLEELTLIKAAEQPTVAAGNTTCIPDRINKMTNEMVRFSAVINDTNDPPLAISDFTVTFKVRDPFNNEIIIASNKKNMQQGDAAGSGIVMILGVSSLYVASINWDPDVTVEVGKYDLFFAVTTPHGTATDGFDNNLEELEIYSTGFFPQITVSDTACIPSSVDKIGTQTTMIYCEFTDPDNPSADSFNVTFKVRPPSNSNQDAITLVDNKAHGGAGEFGGTANVELTGTKYTASYTWDPPETVDIGLYDLYFMVRDEHNNSAEDPFAQNQNELEIVSSVTPPLITAGNTKCVPTSVNKEGSGTTTIYCEFTDSTFTDINDFNVTFKVRDPSNNEIILVNNKPHGASGEDVNQSSTVEITYSGTIFTAWYQWDPPSSVEAGKYDLYFGVKNKAGGFADDKFDDNSNELEIITTGNPPEITSLSCYPPTIPVKGTNTTAIYAEFTDADNPPVTNFTVTFKVRDPNDQELLLVNDKTDSGAGEFGGAVEIIISGSGYMASYDWDPGDDNLTGKYDLFFTVKDESFAEDRSGFDDNLNKLDLTGGAVEPGVPGITPDTPTHTDDNVYNFTITYTDPDNDPPNTEGVTLVIGTNTYKMKEVDPNDLNYTDGKKYYYSIELQEGDYTYYFRVKDTDNNHFESEHLELKVSGKEEPTDKEDDNTMLIAGVVAVIIILVILIILVLVMKNKPEPKEPEKPAAPVAKPAEPGERAVPPPVAKPVELPKKD